MDGRRIAANIALHIDHARLRWVQVDYETTECTDWEVEIGIDGLDGLEIYAYQGATVREAVRKAIDNIQADIELEQSRIEHRRDIAATEASLMPGLI